MTDLALVTDHASQALALLIDQYQGLPRLTGLVYAMVNRVQELEQVLWDVTNKRLLDYTALDGTTQHATGAQLDALGRLVGQKRLAQPDATYLVYIRARIAINKSQGRRGDVSNLLSLIEPTAYSYTEFYPGVVVIEYATATVTDPSILSALAGQVVKAGIRLLIIAGSELSTSDLLLGSSTSGSVVDSAHGLSNSASTTGGLLSGIW